MRLSVLNQVNATVVGLSMMLGLSLAGAVHAEPSKAQIDALFKPWSGSDSPGCSIGVTRNGLPVFQAGYGMAGLEQGVANRADTVYNIASLSKHFTSAAIELLAQQGKLSWDDDVRQYIPQLRDYGAPITLRHLANHTSGIRDHASLLDLTGWNWVDAVTERRMLELISRQKQLNFPTGSRYLYSNSGYVLLAAVVKRVSGLSLGDFSEQQIFKPLGMLHTRFYDDRQMIWKNRAPGYYPRDDGNGFAAWRPTYDEIIGDGALLTSIPDMALWERNFLYPTLGPRPRQLVDVLQQPSQLNDGRPALAADDSGEADKANPSVYTLGLVEGSYRGLRTIAHGGGIPGYASYMLRFPEQKFAVTILCNLGGAPVYELADAVSDLYLKDQFKRGGPTPAPGAHQDDPEDAEEKQPKAVAPAAPLANYAGHYYSEELDTEYGIEVSGNGLQVQVGEAEPEQLIPTGGDTFEGDYTLEFTRDTTGRANGYTLKTERIDGIRFDRKGPLVPRQDDQTP